MIQMNFRMKSERVEALYNHMVRYLCFILTLFYFGNLNAFPVPKLTRQVTDLAGILSVETISSLEQKIREHEKETSNQIAVLTIPTLDGEMINDVAIQVFDEWKLGQKSKNNGVLLLIAKEERKIWISVGRGLEGALTDLQARYIIQNEIRPNFKSGDFDLGVSSGVDKIILTIRGEYTPSASDVATTKKLLSNEETMASGFNGLIVLFFSLFVSSVFGAIVTGLAFFLLYPVFVFLFGKTIGIFLAILLFFLVLFLKSRVGTFGGSGSDGGGFGGGFYSGGSGSWSDSGSDSWGGGGGDSAGGGSGGDW